MADSGDGGSGSGVIGDDDLGVRLELLILRGAPTHTAPRPPPARPLTTVARASRHVWKTPPASMPPIPPSPSPVAKPPQPSPPPAPATVLYAWTDKSRQSAVQ